MEFKQNLNDRIQVKLTPYGRQLISKDLVGIFTPEQMEQYITHCYLPDANGYTEFQLWDFMAIFGKYMSNGAPQIIEKNTIIFEAGEPTPSTVAVIWGDLMEAGDTGFKGSKSGDPFLFSPNDVSEILTSKYIEEK